MNIELIKRLAGNGSVWAKEKLQQVEQGAIESNSEKGTLNPHYNMVDSNNLQPSLRSQIPSETETETASVVIGVRVPRHLYNELLKYKEVSCLGIGATIRKCIADFFYWLPIVNEFKLNQLRTKPSYDI